MLNLTIILMREGASRTSDGVMYEKTSGNGKKLNGQKWNTSYGIQVKVNLTGKEQGEKSRKRKTDRNNLTFERKPMETTWCNIA